MDANAHARIVNLPPPAGYATSFAMPDRAPLGLMRSASEDNAPAPGYAATSSMANAAPKVSYAPMGVSGVLAVLAIWLVWRHLKGAGERMRAMASDAPVQLASWLPDDDHASRIAFEARYGRGTLR